MANVENQIRVDDMRLERIIYGNCSKCGATVTKHRCGYDEECPCCGEVLNWEVKTK